MSEQLYARLVTAQQAKNWLDSAYVSLKPYLIAEKTFTVMIKPETRSNAQNRRLWAMLTDISRQVVWHGQKLQAEDWKHIFSASLKQQRAVPGLDGGFVVLGQSTSKMTKAEMTELQELIQAFGDERSVIWSEPVPEYA